MVRRARDIFTRMKVVHCRSCTILDFALINNDFTLASNSSLSLVQHLSIWPKELKFPIAPGWCPGLQDRPSLPAAQAGEATTSIATATRLDLFTTEGTNGGMQPRPIR